ncbi:MAG: sigma-54-dependent transcriptional regulator [bacterium]
MEKKWSNKLKANNSGDKWSLRILLVDDEQIVHQTLTPYLQYAGHQIDNAYEGDTALHLIETNNYDLAFIDVVMPDESGLSLSSRIEKMCPRLPIVIISARGDMDMVIRALRLGAIDFLRKPIKLREVDKVLKKAHHTGYIRKRQTFLEDTIKGSRTSEYLSLLNTQLVGISPAINEVRRQIQLAVEAQCETILISGETGTGKEVIAHTIHCMGSTEKQPFIAINCPALPDSLVESELFGHVKGAFTGASKDKPGAFELANKGTLFLDEIADLALSTQAKLLRVLETRRLKRLGGTREISVDIRLISATNIPLEALVTSRRIRTDLYYRLNLFTIRLIPLRERTDDIIPLAEYFLSNYLKGRKLPVKGISQEAKDRLMGYKFPGNARELRNIIERAAILCKTHLIEPEHLNFPLSNTDVPYSSQSSKEKELISIEKSSSETHSRVDILNEEKERKYILNALENTRWNRRQAAKDLGIPYSTFRYKLKKYGIS